MNSEVELFYAGIGCTETPEDKMRIMVILAEKLDSIGWTLRSGGAPGADQAFESGATKKRIYLPWKGFENNESEFYEYEYFHEDYARRFHPIFDSLTQVGKRMMIRNSAQMMGMSLDEPLSKMVICWTPYGIQTGGTSQAMRIADHFEIPIFNLYYDDAIENIFDFVKRIHDEQYNYKPENL